MVKLVTHRRANGLLVQRSRAPHCLCGNAGSIPAQTVEVDFVSKQSRWMTSAFRHKAEKAKSQKL